MHLLPRQDSNLSVVDDFRRPTRSPKAENPPLASGDFTQMFFNGVVFTRIIMNEPLIILVATIVCASHSRKIRVNIHQKSLTQKRARQKKHLCHKTDMNV
jgi:hypothetical protein